MNNTYSISELSREFDITPRTIRFYEEQGLLSPARRGQTRIYGSGDRVLLKLILRGKRLGFSLNDSRQLFELYDPSSGNDRQLCLMLEKINERREYLQQQLDDIAIMQNELDQAETRCRQALDKPNNNMTEEMIS